MKFFIKTKLIDRDGRILSGDVDFVRALDYINVYRLTQIEYTAGENSAILTFKGRDRGRGRGRSVQIMIKSAKNSQGRYLYDIAPRVYWRNWLAAKGLKLNILDLLGYMKSHRNEIVEKERGAFKVNKIVLYSNFCDRENRENRIEITVTDLNDPAERF